MTTYRIERLELPKAERTKYFAPVVFCVYLALICVGMIVTSLFLDNRGETMAVIAASTFGLILAALLGGVVLGVQLRELRYLVIASGRPAAENFAAVKRLGESLGWIITREDDPHRLEARTQDTMLNKGEIIVVKFDASDVRVASICNPAVGFSLIGSSRCRELRETVRTALLSPRGPSQ